MAEGIDWRARDWSASGALEGFTGIMNDSEEDFCWRLFLSAGGSENGREKEQYLGIDRTK